MYPQCKPLKKQLQYADRKGFRVAVIAGESEFAAGQWQIKDLRNQQQQTIADADLADVISAVLAN